MHSHTRAALPGQLTPLLPPHGLHAPAHSESLLPALGRRGEVCYKDKDFIAHQLCEQTQTYLASVNLAKSMKHQSSNLMLYFL